MKNKSLHLFLVFSLFVSTVFAQMGGIYSVGTSNILGEVGHFATLREAVTALNGATFNQDVVMLITSNLTEDCSVSGVGLAIDPSPYYVTFKPAPSVMPVVTFNYPTDANSGPSGAFVVGIPHTNSIAWADMKDTKNIIFDGSNSVSGSSRDMTFQSSQTSHRNAFPMLLVGGVSTVVIKNMKIYQQAPGVSTSKKFNGAIVLRNYTNIRPTNISISNNHISSNFAGVPAGNGGIVTYGTATEQFIENISIMNNKIEGKAQCLCLNYTGDISVTGNELIINQNIDGTFDSEAIYIGNSKTTANFVINGNNFSKLYSPLSSGHYLRALTLVAPANTVISNNMITGFETQGASPTGEITALSLNSNMSNIVVAFNSINMINLSADATSSIIYTAVNHLDGNLVLKNNIIKSSETDFDNTLVSTSTITVDMDYNMYLTSSRFGSMLGNWTNDLATWQSTTTQEAHSVSADPMFVSESDLHLQTSSFAEAKGVPVVGVTLDFDGQTRNANTPDIGADEFEGTTTKISTFETLDAKVWTQGNEVKIESPENAKVEIYNMLGARIMETEIQMNTIHSIRVNEASAVYIVKVKAENSAKIQKVFIK